MLNLKIKKMKWIKLLFINKQMTKFQMLNKVVTDSFYSKEDRELADKKLTELIKDLQEE